MKAKLRKHKLHDLVVTAVEAGISYGYNRAFKHTDTPTEDYIKEQLELAVMHQLYDILEFEEYEE